MSEQTSQDLELAAEGRDYYRQLHKDSAETIPLTEQEIKDASHRIVESQIAARASASEVEREKHLENAKEAQRVLNNANDAHLGAHKDYAYSVLESKEHYDEDANAYHELAKRDAAADGIETNFGESSEK